VKGYACTVSAASGKRIAEAGRAKKTILQIVGSYVMGKEEALGKVLMKAFFETMKVYKQLPHTIFFLNTGVYLTTTHSDIVPLLQDIAGMGVEIYSCGTCLTQYNLESELKVGHRGTMNIVVEGMQDFEKVVWM
jgi:selenium metabolism protein YedF